MSEEKENKVEVKPTFQGIDDSGMDFQYEEDVNKLNYWFYRNGSICGCSGSSGGSGSGGSGGDGDLDNTNDLVWDDMTGKDEPPSQRKLRQMRIAGGNQNGN